MDKKMIKKAVHQYKIYRQLKKSSFSSYVPSLLPLVRFCKELNNTINCFKNP